MCWKNTQLAAKTPHLATNLFKFLLKCRSLFAGNDYSYHTCLSLPYPCVYASPSSSPSPIPLTPFLAVRFLLQHNVAGADRVKQWKQKPDNQPHPRSSRHHLATVVCSTWALADIRGWEGPELHDASLLLLQAAHKNAGGWPVFVWGLLPMLLKCKTILNKQILNFFPLLKLASMSVWCPNVKRYWWEPKSQQLHLI